MTANTLCKQSTGGDQRGSPGPLALATGGALLLLLLFSRRPSALLTPNVWCEDGTQVLPSLLLHGASSFLMPVNGYLPTSSKLLSALSLTFGLGHYPLVSSLLALLFSLVCALAVWLCPTHLHYRFFCALACVCIPTDPECFGTPLYSFWWAGLVLLLLVVWKTDTSKWKARMAMLVFCGLSSPIVVPVAGLLVLRALVIRTSRHEWYLAATAIFVAGIQMGFLTRGDSAKAFDLVAATPQVIPKFFGGFVTWPVFRSPDTLLFAQWTASFLMGTALVCCVQKWSVWLKALIALYLATVAATALRIPPADIHPLVAGPRYFLYPFITLFWVFAYAAHDSAGWRKNLLLGVCCLALSGSLFSWSRNHFDLRWSDHLRSAAFFDSYAMPVQVDGRIHAEWESSTYGGEPIPWPEFGSKTDEGKTFSYRKASELSQGGVTLLPRGLAKALSNSFEQCLQQDASLADFDLFGSPPSEGPQTGSVKLRLVRGASVLFKTGPFTHQSWGRISVAGREKLFFCDLPTACTDWTVLQFSNKNLPEEFDVEFADEGAGREEWFQLAIPKISGTPNGEAVYSRHFLPAGEPAHHIGPPLFFIGWHAPEPELRWTKEKRSAVEFVLDDRGAGASRLYLQGHANGEQQLSLSINGHPFYSGRVPGGVHSLSFSIPAGLLRKGKNTLGLELPEARRPDGHDKRTLGFGLQVLRIE